MKHHRRLSAHSRLFPLLLFLLLCAVPPETFPFVNVCRAEEKQPEQILEQAVAAMKTGGGAAALVDYVDWNFLFATLAPSARRALNVHSADEFRDYNRRFYADPSSHIAKQLQIEFASRKAENVPLSKEDQAEITRMTAKQVEDFNHRLAYAQYSFGKATISGTEAQVPYEALAEGVVTTAKASLTRASGRWLLAEFPIRVDAPTRNPSDDPSKAPTAEFRHR